MEAITISTRVSAPLESVWSCWTLPEHVKRWNHASPEWHCPDATNKLVVGGEFHYLMAAKDGSESFDFTGRYTEIQEGRIIRCLLADGREMTVSFHTEEGATVVKETFEPEDMNPLELQEAGWQAILDSFKDHVEGMAASRT